MRLRGFAAIGTTASMFGLGIVLAKLVSGVLNSFFFTFLCLAGGGILLALFLFVSRQPVFPALPRTLWKDMLILTCFGTVLSLLIVLIGLAHTSAVIGGVLLQLEGPAAVFFAIPLLHERLSWRQALGSAILLLGSILVVLQPEQPLAWQDSLLGILLVTTGAFIYGFALIPTKRLAAQSDSVQLSVLRLLLGAVCILPFLFFQPTLVFGPISWSMIWILLLYIVTTYCIGYITQQLALRDLKVWEAAAVLQSTPLFTALSALLITHETLTLLQIGGCLLVLIGGIFVVGRNTAAAEQVTSKLP